MKFVLMAVAVALLVVPLTVHAKETTHEPMDFSLALGVNNAHLARAGATPYADLRAHLYLLGSSSQGLSFGIQAGLAYGPNYLQVDPTAVLGAATFLLGMTNPEEDLPLGALLASALLAVSDGALTIRLDSDLELEPYWSLLRLTQVRALGRTNSAVTGAAGLGLNKYFGSRFFVGAQLEYDWAYGHVEHDVFDGVSYGARIGFAF